MESRDIYIKLADPQGKKRPVINHHRVWDGARFIAEQHKQHGKDAKPDEIRIVTEATASDYMESRRTGQRP